jgi:hypothetical protein
LTSQVEDLMRTVPSFSWEPGERGRILRRGERFSIFLAAGEGQNEGCRKYRYASMGAAREQRS